MTNTHREEKLADLADELAELVEDGALAPAHADHLLAAARGQDAPRWSHVYWIAISIAVLVAWAAL